MATRHFLLIRIYYLCKVLLRESAKALHAFPKDGLIYNADGIAGRVVIIFGILLLLIVQLFLFSKTPEERFMLLI